MKYSCIYADPPWSYRDKMNAGKRGAAHKYKCMSIDDICALPVASISAADAVLFLWATWPHMPDWLRVMEAWGFEYRGLGFDWTKTNIRSGTPFWGNGAVGTRSNSEPCLMAFRGRGLKRVSKSVHSSVQAPHPRDLRGKIIHSAKPPEVRRRIVELFGPVPRVELFARERVTGWDAWGDEIASDITL